MFVLGAHIVALARIIALVRALVIIVGVDVVLVVGDALGVDTDNAVHVDPSNRYGWYCSCCYRC